MLARSGVEPVAVKRAEQLDQVEGLIIPGGESTTIGKLLTRFELMGPLRDRIADGMPVYGTCAGAIVLARDVVGRGVDQPVLGVLDATIHRNAFGRQVDSFEAELQVPEIGSEPFHAVFIRAPTIEKVGPGVEVIGRLEDGTIVAVRQENLLATSFHPELTDDARFHEYFAQLVRTGRAAPVH
jgi:5'-phosphate synthase pdxT subunit